MNRRWSKALAMTTPLVFSTVLTFVVFNVMPAHIANPLSLSGLAIGVLLLAGRFEGTAALILGFTRRPTTGELATLAPVLAGLTDYYGQGPPVVKLRVHTQPSPNAVTAFGRRTLILNPTLIHDLARGRITVHDAGDALARGVLIVRGGLTRSDAFLSFWTLPWQIIAGIIEGVASVFRGYPLTRFFWRARFVTIGIAVIQHIHDGWYGFAAFTALVGTLSYTAPAWIRRWNSITITYGQQALAALPPARADIETIRPVGAAAPSGHATWSRQRPPGPRRSDPHGSPRACRGTTSTPL
jgi:hypothetical protein